MKAALFTNKNDKDLASKDILTPVCGDHEVLITIKPAAVNPLDLLIMNGDIKLIVSYSLPLVMGNECAGVVKQVGKSVTRFKVGDYVYGRLPLHHIGAFAQYISVSEDSMALMPTYLSFEEAASVPLTALTAMQAFAVMHVKAGDSLFISGGTGSLGAMAIPIAKHLGLHVYTNGNGENEARVRALGTEKFIDYKKENYVNVLSNVDHVLDTLGDRELPNEFAILKEGGHLVSLRGMPNRRFAKRMGMSFGKQLLFGFADRKFDRMAAKKHQTYDFLFVHEDGQQLERCTNFFDKDHPLKTSIDSVYTLDQINEALAHVRSGHSKGKTIIRMD